MTQSWLLQCRACSSAAWRALGAGLSGVGGLHAGSAAALVQRFS